VTSRWRYRPVLASSGEPVAVAAASWSQSLRAAAGSWPRVHGSGYSGRGRRSCQNRPLPSRSGGIVASQTIVSAPSSGFFRREQDRSGGATVTLVTLLPGPAGARLEEFTEAAAPSSAVALGIAGSRGGIRTPPA